MIDNDSILKVVVAAEKADAIDVDHAKEAKMKGLHPSFRIKKRRSAMDRLKARMTYRRNKNKIRIWRKRYNQKNKMRNASRKHLRRPKPKWFSKHKTNTNRKPHHKSFFHKLMGTHHTHARPLSHGSKKHSFGIKTHKTLSHFKPKRPRHFH